MKKMRALLVFAIYPAFVFGASQEPQSVEQATGAATLGQLLWDSTFVCADGYLDGACDTISQHSISKKISDFPSLCRRLREKFPGYQDIAGGVFSAVIAYRCREEASNCLTWTNAAYAASIIYFANRLMPDWAKDCACAVPFWGKLVDARRFESCHVWHINPQGKRATIHPAQSTSLALFEYALGVCALYGMRNYLSFDKVAKAALACNLLCLFSPKCKVIKILILRRLLV